jgi:hypothetical protein
VTTGFLNVLNWYTFAWFFPPVHRFLGSVLLHIGVKLPDIAYGLKAGRRRGPAVHYGHIIMREGPKSLVKKVCLNTP